MSRNLKILGLALVAVLATSAIAAAAGAQAVTPEFHLTAGSGTGTAKGSSNDNVFTVEGGNVKCTEKASVPGAQFEVTGQPLTSTTAVVVPIYKNCKAFGVEATVAMEGCTYLFHLVEGSSPPTAKVDVVCPTGKSITVSAPSLPCTITIGAQTGLEHVTFTNSGGTEPTDITANIAIGESPKKAITYTKTGAGCPGGAGTGTNGKYTGTVTLRGFNSAGTQVGLHVF